MTSFSERYGYRPIKSAIQLDYIDESLRNSLWSVLYEAIARPARHVTDGIPRFVVVFHMSPYKTLLRQTWFAFFKAPMDTLPDDWDKATARIRSIFLEGEWFRIYDFIELTVKTLPDSSAKTTLVEGWNEVLETEISAYRIVGNEVVRMTSKVEIDEVEAAIGSSATSATRIHLQRALALLSDRQTPDFRNSIKESISAVEAISAKVSGEEKATLGQALKKLEASVNTHPALNKAFQALYGYTSDADGIRHALLEEDKLEFEDAKFMLVACSAFVNYLQEKARKGGITFD